MRVIRFRRCARAFQKARLKLSNWRFNYGASRMLLIVCRILAPDERAARFRFFARANFTPSRELISAAPKRALHRANSAARIANSQLGDSLTFDRTHTPARGESVRMRQRELSESEVRNFARMARNDRPRACNKVTRDRNACRVLSSI